MVANITAEGLPKIQEHWQRTPKASFVCLSSLIKAEDLQGTSAGLLSKQCLLPFERPQGIQDAARAQQM